MPYGKPTPDNDRAAKSIIRDLERFGGLPCAGCGAALCHHQMLICTALGFKDAPRGLCRRGSQPAFGGKFFFCLREQLIFHIA